MVLMIHELALMTKSSVVAEDFETLIFTQEYQPFLYLVLSQYIGYFETTPEFWVFDIGVH